MRRLNVKLFVILLCSIATLAVVTVVVHRLQAGNIANALLYQTEQAEKEGRGDQAARFLGRYLEFVPQDLEQRARLGAFLSEPRYLATAKGQKRARFVLEQVLARSPEHHASRISLVRVALAARMDELAKEHLPVLEKAIPNSADVLELKAVWQEQKGMDAPAAESYRKAIAQAPDRVENHVRLTHVLRRLEPGKPRTHASEIEQLTKKALELAADKPGVLSIAADGALDRDDVAGARVYLQKGRELHPKDVRFYLSLARLEERAGQHKAALDVLQNGIEQLPKERHFEIRWAQANLHLDAGELDKARDAAHKLRDLPGTETAQNFLQARMLMQQNLWFESARAFERLEPTLKSSRDLSLQVSLYLGICYEQMNEPAKQLAAFRKVVELDPQNPLARRGIAMAHWALGATDLALQSLRETATLTRDAKDGSRSRVELTRMMLLAEMKKETRNWSALERELDAADKESPDSLELLTLRAEMLHQQGKQAQARELLTNAMPTHGKKSQLSLALASLHERADDLKEAERVLSEAPDTMEVRLARARVWAAKKDPSQVDKLKSLEVGAEKFESDDRARLMHGLAMAHFQLDQAKEAERLWWHITTLPRHGDNIRVRFLLLDLAIQQNDEAAMQRVLENLQKVEVTPKAGEGALYRFGLALKYNWQARHGKKEMAQEARKLLTMVEADRPQWDAAALARAEADEILGNLDQAIANYRKAQELGVRSPEVGRKLVFLLTQSHRFDEAEKEIARLQKQNPLSDDVQRLAVDISMKRDDYGKAEQLIRKSMIGKKDWRDHVYLSQVLAGDGRTEEAEKELLTALSLEMTQSEVYVALVRLLVRAGKMEQAEAQMKAMSINVPQDKQDVAMAQCQEILGRFDEAEVHLTKALKSQPENPLLLKMHASFLIRTGRMPQSEPVLRTLARSSNSGDAGWARRHLALVLTASGDVKLRQEAMEIVGVTIDALGNITDEKASESADELLARAKVLALQSRKPLRTRSISLLEALQKKHLLGAEDQFLLAQLYLNQGPEPVWWGKARDLLIGLVKSYPRHPQYLHTYAQQALKHKDLGEADRMTTKLEQVEKARGLVAGGLGSIELRARIFETAGNSKKALSMLQDYARMKDAPPERGFLVAALQGRMGLLKDAIETTLAIKAPPEAQARSLTGILRRYHVSSHFAKNTGLWNEQVEAVEAHLNKAIAAEPEKLSLRLHMADLQDLLGRYEAVESLCREVLARDPNNLAALNNLSWLLAQRKTQPDEALKLVTRAIEVHGPRPELLDTRAVVYLTLGKCEPALADLERATRDGPSAAKYFNLARAHHLMRNSKSAMEALNQATALGLDDRSIHPTEREIYRQVTAELKGR